MATSWLIAVEKGERKVIETRSRTTRGVRNAARNHMKAGTGIVAGYLGGTGPIALARKVFPA